MPVKRLYSKWMFDWETRMTTRDSNRVVRPFEWGVEWSRDWPQAQGIYPEGEITFKQAENYFLELNRRIVADSDKFFDYETPSDFHLSRRMVPGEKTQSHWLHFTSPIDTPHATNNHVRARWFPSPEKNGKRSKKAVVLLPHWNSKPHSYLALCRILQKLGLSTLRISLPYHDARLPAETQRSDYAVSSNVGRTIDATRQAVIDARCCFDWLEQQGYEDFGIVGTSLGSCYAFLVSAHDPRIRVNAFNHASTYFADVVWHGQSTRHIRAGLEGLIELDTLRECWAAISPPSYWPKFKGQNHKKILVIYATYDLTFLPEFSQQVVAGFAESGLDHKVKVLPCGHYSTGEAPFKFIDGWHIGKFLKTSL
jgi:dienelactone hydrolase